MNVDGIAAIVTGGASGLGAATAEHLARAGARVTIFDLNAAEAEAHARRINGRSLYVDVTDEDAVRAAIADAEQRHGIARVLVNCAGLAPPAKVIGRDERATPLAGFAKLIGVNLVGTFNVLSKVAERLQHAEPIGEERGVIVNTASVAAYEGQIGQAAYAASKGGVVSMTLPIAREFARHAIRVMAVAPGLFHTPLLAALPPEAQESLGRQVPFPSRLGRPEEFARLVHDIIANPMLNGEVIRLDGAIRMAPR